jgi:hypothetical protein
MDSNDLKIILNLKEENMLMHRAIVDAAIALKNRKQHLVLEYGISDVSFLFSEIKDILLSFEDKKQPSQQCNNSNDDV